MKFVKSTLLFFFMALMAGLVLNGCKKDDPVNEETSLAKNHNSAVPKAWFKLYETIDRFAPGCRPPASARALAYIGLAGYEAAVPGMPEYNTFGGYYAGLVLPKADLDRKYHWPTAVNAAYHHMIIKMVPHTRTEDLQAAEDLYNSFNDQFKQETGNEVFERSRAFGEAVADAIYFWSATDVVGHQAYLNPRPSNYIPPVGPGLWQPSYPDFTPALFPYWGQVRTFAMHAPDLVCKAPLQWSNDPNSQISIQAKEAQVQVDRIRQGLDPEARWIAEFWSDDFFGVTFTPAGRWIAIANQVVEQQNVTLDKGVELYAKMGMALCDAGIAVWNSKFIYNYERPVHYIRRNFASNWETIMNHPYTGVTGITPEFPSYPSGHSGFGGAAAIVLTDMFGYQYTLTDRCHEDRSEFNGTPRTFDSFIDMAVENAFSRVPLGVHFRMDCEVGLDMGYLAGERVLDLPWKQ
jgi:membrane-associated phospholipid phosphatase